MSEDFLAGAVRLFHGDSRDVLKGLADNSIDSVVCDPPYALVSILKRFGKVGVNNYEGRGEDDPYRRAAAGFMGKQWDTGETAFAVEFWAEVMRVLKPGGHVVAFSGTRTYHRLAVAIEDSGFEIRDCIFWCYGSGFPKSHDVSKGIDKAAGAERERSPTIAMQKGSAVGEISKNLRCATCGKARASGNPCTCPRLEDIPATDAAREWQGWGTALKPSIEPICLARKPLEGTVAANVLKWGTGALNIDGCRIGETVETWPSSRRNGAGDGRTCARGSGEAFTASTGEAPAGRWPANLVHDGSDEVVAGFPETASGAVGKAIKPDQARTTYGAFAGGERSQSYQANEGSAARFFYTAKADAIDRMGSKHPTVKPVDLMQWLCRLVTPKGGTVLDPFSGTGTTGEAAWREGFKAVLVEREEEYVADIRRRLELAAEDPLTRRNGAVKASGKAKPIEGLEGSLFA